MKLLFLVFVFVAALSLPLAAQNVVYVSNGPGNQVLAVNSNGTVSALYTQTGFVPEDGTYGPDGKLYFCDPTNGRIVRIDIATRTATTVFQQPSGTRVAPQGPRFTWSGDLIFTDKLSGALYAIYGAAGASTLSAPQLLAQRTGPGAGTAFSHTGELYYAVGSNLWRWPAGGPAVFSFPSSSIRGVARDGSNNIWLAESNGRLFRCSVGSPVVCTQRDTNFVGDIPNYIEISAANVLWVGTSNAIGENGKLWRINLNEDNDRGSAVLLPKRRGIVPPAIGVAIPPTSKQLTETIFTSEAWPAASRSHLYNFGANAMRLGVIECAGSALNATVRSTQRLTSEINARLANTLYNGTPVRTRVVRESGQEGLARVFTVNASGCATPSLFAVDIAAFWPTPYAINPAIVRCSPNVDAGTCEIQDNYGYWINSGFLPDDGGVSTRSKGFSDIIFVDVEFQLGTATYGGILPPFDPRSDDANGRDFPTIFNLGRNITVKFQAFDAQGNPVRTLNAVISVERITPGTIPTPINVTPSGSSSEPPVFRLADPAYIYNLNTGNPGWTTGLYAVHITAINGFTPRTAYFCLDRCN